MDDDLAERDVVAETLEHGAGAAAQVLHGCCGERGGEGEWRGYYDLGGRGLIMEKSTPCLIQLLRPLVSPLERNHSGSE